MANSKSAQKRIRQIAKKTEVNTARRSRIRSFIKKVEQAIASGDKKSAQEALRVAQPEIQRGVSKKTLHPNTASRKISRLSKHIASMS